MAAFKSDTRVFEELRRKIGKAKDAQVKVGVLASQGGGASAGKTTLAELAAIHEYGAPRAGIPARSFLRATFEGEGREDLTKFLERLARAIIAEKLEVDKALEKLGAWAIGAVKRRIKSHIDPPLRPATLKKKTVGGKTGDVPLIDTGQLINALTWEVKR